MINFVDKETIELTIHNAKVSNIGTYQVVLTNALGETESEGKLVVLKKPTITFDEKLKQRIEVTANQQNLHISCDTSGFPRPTVTWLRNGVTVDQDRARVDSGETYTILHVNKIKRAEQGTYTLTVKNEAGKATADFEVVVIDIPSAPVKLTADDITGKSCKLKWSPPVNDGG
jgi:hypothetical protein